MTINRRNFIKLSTMAGGALNLGLLPGAALLAQETMTQRRDAPVEKAARPMRLLILGGTGFTGPHQVRYALARGHKVTVFNRGKTNPGSVPAGVERLQGDRSN